MVAGEEGGEQTELKALGESGLEDGIPNSP